MLDEKSRSMVTTGSQSKLQGLTTLSSKVRTFWTFSVNGSQQDHRVKRRGNEEQTAHLQTALLHLLCGPRYEPLGGAPFAMRVYAIAFPSYLSSFPTAGLTCLLHLQFHVLQKKTC